MDANGPRKVTLVIATPTEDSIQSQESYLFGMLLTLLFSEPVALLRLFACVCVHHCCYLLQALGHVVGRLYGDRICYAYGYNCTAIF